MSEASNTPSVRRWDGLTSTEFHLIHHALRMLVKYLSDFDTDKATATALADEMWSVHCNRLHPPDPVVREALEQEC